MSKEGSKLEQKRRQQSDRIAESIKEQERRKEEIKFQDEWNKRIDIAREARVAYEGQDPVTAVINYKKILSLTARRYNVPVEQLHPKLFDPKNRTSEALLISAICFDLAKIVDRLETPNAVNDLRLYLRLFVNFSKGMAFEVAAASTLRKYVQYTRGLKHKAIFDEHYASLKRGSGCFVATVAYGDYDAPEVQELRRFRDRVLRQSVAGRLFIFCYYYFLGPIAARLLDRSTKAKRLTRLAIEAALPRLRQL